ncbi:glycoside hydrolase family 78 protein [Streptomyces sp. NBC_00670]|jgi:alpha-L-rhamnosidase|uniref:glycoside hydrolase family 78 protein n=1 Tax=Streptomyces sp. NBC_00670 TaxID=2975804 RepID=UPI002E356A8A|nr:glycoside hydrolase family 78 protein [Streptomyces sp. NBC_00670]
MTRHTLRVTDLRAEHHRQPLGIGERRPRLSWHTVTDRPGQTQTAYEVRLTEFGNERVRHYRIPSAESVLVPWPGGPLVSRQRVEVAVRVWGQDGEEPSAWSEPLPVEAGLLDPADWSARLVSPARSESADGEAPPSVLRGAFRLGAPVTDARLHLTAHGVYEAELNGVRVGDHVLAPGWTHYPERLRHHTHDITGLLHEGANELRILLADGWYRGRLGFGGGTRDTYGDRLAALAQIEVRHPDGTTATFGTGPDWQAAPGPLLSSGIYEGEAYDARREPHDWQPVDVLPYGPARLVAPDGPPVRRTEILDPVAVLTSPSGRTVLDFGQNLVGRLRIRVEGEPGRAITLRHAEVLEDGELCVRPLRHATATDTYTPRGTAGGEEWEPRFTYHGFRYAEVKGWPGELRPGDVRAVVLHTDMRRTGWFSCSEPLLNRLHENVVRSMRGNFLDIPTDCPQRDERLGWTGDVQIFAPTATFLYDCAGVLRSWLKDLAAQQHPDGRVPMYVPHIPTRFPELRAAAWGDAAVIVPWTLYERYGDLGVLADQYASMKAWVDGIAAVAGDRHLWDTDRQLGDWLDPAAPPDRPGDARTDPHLVATAYYAHSAGLLARTAALLGHGSDHARYSALSDAVRAAFRDAHLTADGLLTSDAQTAYALALRFGLLATDEQRARAGRRLAELVREEDFHIGTGFVGTPLICDALCEAGEYDTAYRLLLRRTCPSWLYPVTMGATTVWERWDSMLPDGSVNPGEMTSFNHYALGAVADWMHRTVAGLAPAAPGYRRLRVRPRPGGGLTHACAAHDTPYGRAEVSWSRTGSELRVRVTVPHGTTALIDLPGRAAPEEAGPGTHLFRTETARP